MKVCFTYLLKPSLLTVGKFCRQEETLDIFSESIDNFPVNSLSYTVCRGLSSWVFL